MNVLTVGTLAENRALGLRLVAGVAGAERAVRGAHTSDLDRPARYLLPDELVLTNGLWERHVGGATWARDVHGVGAAGIAYGLSAEHPAPPVELVRACDELELPLLLVPEELSFAAVADAVADAQDQSGLRTQISRTRRLLQRLAAGGGHPALLDFLRQETQLPVWLVGPGGRPIGDADGDWPGTEVARAAARALRRSELPGAVGPDACAFGTAVGHPAASVLLVGRPLAEVGDEERLVIDQVAAYVVLEDARVHAGREGRRVLGDELVELVWSGDLSEPSFAARLSALGMEPRAAVTVAASSNDRGDVEYAVLACGRPGFVASHRERTIAVLAGDAESVPELVADGGAEPVLGIGSPGTGVAGVRQSLAEAIAAHTVARSRPAGERVVRHLDVGSHHVLLNFVDRQVLHAFRETLIGPIERWDARREAELVRTLRTFLEHDGQWRATARTLHIHHNTLRYRLQRVAELTGRDVDTTAGRVDFALALAIAPSPGA